jgi:hypothetical protein
MSYDKADDVKKTWKRGKGDLLPIAAKIFSQSGDVSINNCSNPLSSIWNKSNHQRLGMDVNFIFTCRWDANTYKHAVKVVVE